LCSQKVGTSKIYIQNTLYKNGEKMPKTKPQPQTSKKPLGKGVVIGIVLLILSFIFFLLAGIIAYNDAPQSNDLVKIFIAVGALFAVSAVFLIFVDSRSGIFVSTRFGIPKPKR
jgi:hypothetical protein